jgi:hypothetical protein
MGPGVIDGYGYGDGDGYGDGSREGHPEVEERGRGDRAQSLPVEGRDRQVERPIIHEGTQEHDCVGGDAAEAVRLVFRDPSPRELRAGADADLQGPEAVHVERARKSGDLGGRRHRVILGHAGDGTGAGVRRIVTAWNTS